MCCAWAISCCASRADLTAQRPIFLHVAGRTDVGLVREHNEDNFVVVDLTTREVLDVTEMRSLAVGPRGVVMLVCDGMGGAAAGEIASAMAVETVREVMSNTSDAPELAGEELKVSFAQRLRSAAYAANDRIYEAARTDPSKIGMGTTMTAVGVIAGHLVMAQVGDSRAYLLRTGFFTQVTRDQSLLNELLETGQITEEQAPMFEHSNVILQALGVQPDVEVLLSTVELRRGDRLVVCSDGLTSVVTDEEVGALAVVSDDVAESCRLLIDVARSAGGPDNITAIVARFDGEGLYEPSEEEPPIRYVRWLLEEPSWLAQRSVRAEPPQVIAPVDTKRLVMPPHRQEFAHTFFSAMLLFAMLLGSLIVGSALRRDDAGIPCIVFGAPGLSIRVDGFDTGIRTTPGGTVVRLPHGSHLIGLYGPAGPAGERNVDASYQTSCTAHFEGAP
jgi:serine/threonine protein phosphatase PrpC